MGIPNFMPLLPVDMYGWVSVVTSGLTRIPILTFVLPPSAMRATCCSSSVDSTFKWPIPD